MTIRRIGVVAIVVAVSIYAYHALLEAGYDLFPAGNHPGGLNMSAAVYRSVGEADVLQYEEDFPRPFPHPHQVIVEVHAASLNPCDYKFRRNYIPSFVRPLPNIPGGDIAGVVVQVGDSVTKVAVGDRVAALIPLLGSKWGGYAEYVAVNADYVAIIPSKLSFPEAASLPLVALTAMTAFDNIPLPHSNKKVLIHAGSGGVGSFAIQYAKQVLRFVTVATTCSHRNKDFVTSLGATDVIDYTTTDFIDVVKNFDVIIDPMSFLYEEQSLQPGVLKPSGQYFNILSSDFSLASDGSEKGNGLRTFLGPLVARVGRALGLDILDYRTISVAPNGAVLQRVFNEVEKGTVLPLINITFPLREAAEAMRYLEKGRTTGKVVLIVRNE